MKKFQNTKNALGEASSSNPLRAKGAYGMEKQKDLAKNQSGDNTTDEKNTSSRNVGRIISE